MNLFRRIISGLTGAVCAVSAAVMPVGAVEEKPQETDPSRPAWSDCRADFPLVKLGDIPNKRCKSTNPGVQRAPSVDGAPAAEEAYIPLLIISIGFANEPYDDNYNIAAQYFDGGESVSAYYHDQSFGQFTFVPAEENSVYRKGGNTNRYDEKNDGVVHVRLSSDHEDWSSFYYADADADIESCDKAYNTSLFYALSDAMQKADACVNFSDYDENGDDHIDTSELAICFAIAGLDAAGVVSEDYDLVDRKRYFWPVASAFSTLIWDGGIADTSSPELDGIIVDSFIAVTEQVQEEVYGDTATLCHELGHYLGLPDLYDTTYAEDVAWYNYNVEMLSLMAAGTNQMNPDGGLLPSSLDIWSKWMLEWTEPEQVYENGIYEITAEDYSNISKGYKTIMIPTQREYEYYLIENRQPDKWDRGLSYSMHELYDDMTDPIWNQDGLIIWHVDMTDYYWYEESNTVNACDHHPCVMPLYGEQIEPDKTEYTNFGVFPSVMTGFYSRSVWEKRFGERLGDQLNLPVYGLDDPDDRDARWLSGITVEFLDDSDSTMHVAVDFDNYKRVIGHSEYIAPDEWYYGMKEYWYDAVRDEYYSDPEGTNVVDYDSLWILPIGWKEETEETSGQALTVTLYGDANIDGAVNIMDVITVNKFLVGSGKLTPQAELNADVDGSGTVDSADSLNILKAALDMIALPVKK